MSSWNIERLHELIIRFHHISLNNERTHTNIVFGCLLSLRIETYLPHMARVIGHIIYYNRCGHNDTMIQWYVFSIPYSCTKQSHMIFKSKSNIQNIALLSFILNLTKSELQNVDVTPFTVFGVVHLFTYISVIYIHWHRMKTNTNKTYK